MGCLHMNLAMYVLHHGHEDAYWMSRSLRCVCFPITMPTFQWVVFLWGWQGNRPWSNWGGRLLKVKVTAMCMLPYGVYTKPAQLSQWVIFIGRVIHYGLRRTSIESQGHRSRSWWWTVVRWYVQLQGLIFHITWTIYMDNLGDCCTYMLQWTKIRFNVKTSVVFVFVCINYNLAICWRNRGKFRTKAMLKHSHNVTRWL